jgi:hypothetical protein
MTLALILLSCSIVHPVTQLKIDALQHEKELEKEMGRSKELRYILHQEEAASITEGIVSDFAEVVHVTPELIESDWIYRKSKGVDDDGEWVILYRDRIVARIVGSYEKRIELDRVSQQQKFRANEVKTGWETEHFSYDTEKYMERFEKIENGHLQNLKLNGSFNKLKGAAKIELPMDFEMVQDGNQLIATKIYSKEKEGKKGRTAVWMYRHSIVLTLSDKGDQFSAQSFMEQRFDTEKEIGHWERRGFVDTRPMKAWVGRLLLKHSKLVSLTSSTLEAPTLKHFEKKLPPPISRLRAIDEVESIVTQRAMQNSTGEFEICLAGLVVNASPSEDRLWDPPAEGEDTEDLLDSMAVSEDVNLLAEKLSFMEEGEEQGLQSVKRQKSIEFMNDLAEAARLGRDKMPHYPDVYGKIQIENQSKTVPREDDRNAPVFDYCFKQSFQYDEPLLGFSFYDQDPVESIEEPIGQCTVSLSLLHSNGPKGFACGDARLFVNTSFNFSLDQAELVGLPPLKE